MKRPVKKLIALIVLPLCFAFAAAGCNQSGDRETGGGYAVSYISANSAVYSSTAEVVEAVADTVVEIQTESVATKWGMQYIVSGAGSGVIVGSKDNLYYIVTNNHVIDGANEITVATRTGTQFEAVLVATDDSADIAVITVQSEQTLSIAVWGDSDQLKVGEDLIAIGNPLGSLGGTVTKGILSAKDRSIIVGDFAMTLLQTDTAINPGNSGGGLFNMRGELIGVVNAKTSDEEIEGICFAIPGNTARSVYSDLVEHGYIVGRASFGLTLSEGTISSMMGSQSQTFIYVSEEPSNAASGTFMCYDRILSVNGVQISSVLEYNVVMSQISAGDTVAVEVYRGSVTQGMFGSSKLSFSSEVTRFEVTAAQYGA